jgi:hypothetical protein
MPAHFKGAAKTSTLPTFFTAADCRPATGLLERTAQSKAGNPFVKIEGCRQFAAAGRSARPSCARRSAVFVEF